MNALAAGVPTVSRGEIDAARLELLRRRLVVFSTAVGILMTLLGAAVIAAILLRQSRPARPLFRPEILAVVANIAGGALLIVIPRLRRKDAQKWTARRLVRRTTAVVVAAASSQVVSAAVLARFVTEVMHERGGRGRFEPGWVLAGFVVVLHSTAAIIVPWTLREAVRAMAIILVVLFVLSLDRDPDAPSRAFVLGVMVLAGLPGVVISGVRSTHLHDVVALRILSGRYAAVEQEMAWARRLHERLFPKPLSEGPVRLAYRYEPMRQIGGDYFDLTVGAGGSVTIVMVDVTGHGVAAALAVNRLHGEIKRVFASDAETSREELVRALNAYVHLTLADEGVFATAVALRVDPRAGRLDYSSAGHPPILVRRRDGRVESLEPTSTMLGALPPDGYDGAGASVALTPGDVVVAYTDGAVECRDAADRELGLEGVRRAVEGAPGGAEGVAAALERAVKSFRAGPAQDDMLVVAMEVAV